MTELPSRKLAILLHADVARSTEIVQLDEAVAHLRMQDLFRRFSSTIGEHNGTTHEIRGDALVAEFANASDAIAASLEFQRENREHNAALDGDIRPEIRIGIAMGEVVIADNTVTGEGIVLAQRLEQYADIGGICAQAAVCETVPKRFPFEFKDTEEKILKGFDGPVRFYSVVSKTGGNQSQIDDFSESRSDQSVFPDNPSIAVLPFTNMSGDPEQEYFSDGITEDIITELSRFPFLFVIARNSSFVFKGSQVDIKEVGRKLGVRYVVEGSVRKSGERVRITAQLIEAENGNHVWADRYDHHLEDVFEIQDDVTRKVVSQVSHHIDKARLNIARRKEPNNIQAYDLWLLGISVYREYSVDGTNKARKFFQQAIDLDPQFARAHAGIASTYLNDIFVHNKRGMVQKEVADNARKFAREAIKLDDRDSESHLALGWVYKFLGEFDRARNHFDKAVQLSPNHADTVAHRGWVLAYLGEGEIALQDLMQAKQLNPFHQDWYHFCETVAYFVLHQYENALSSMDQMTEISSLEHLAWYAMLNARLGRMDEAHNRAQIFLDEFRAAPVSSPELEDDSLLENFINRKRFRRPEDTDNFVQGLSGSGIAPQHL